MFLQLLQGCTCTVPLNFCRVRRLTPFHRLAAINLFCLNRSRGIVFVAYTVHLPTNQTSVASLWDRLLDDFPRLLTMHVVYDLGTLKNIFLGLCEPRGYWVTQRGTSDAGSYRDITHT